MIERKVKPQRRSVVVPAVSYVPLVAENEILSVTNTTIVVEKENEEGDKFINQYMIIKELGRLLNNVIIGEVMVQ